MRAHHDPNDPMLHTGMLKGFMDGSLGSRTAALKAPYADDPGNTGLPQFTQAQLNEMAVERAQGGVPVGVSRHRRQGRRRWRWMLLCSLALAERRRNRIEHAQVVDPADIPRFADWA